MGTKTDLKVKYDKYIKSKHLGEFRKNMLKLKSFCEQCGSKLKLEEI